MKMLLRLAFEYDGDRTGLCTPSGHKYVPDDHPLQRQVKVILEV